MPVLKISRKSYPAALLRRWEGGDYECFPWPNTSKFVRGMLLRKAKTRLEGRTRRGKEGSRRFFGEAYVATHDLHKMAGIARLNG